jgi:CRP-like cAMP-binding protein
MVARRGSGHDKTAPVQAAALGLRSVALLDGLPQASLEAIARQCAWRSFAPGQRIVAREADDRSVHLLISGRVRVTMYSRSGRQVSFGEQAAGEFLGELSAIDGMRRALDVEAVETTLVATLTPATFQQLVREYPAVAERVLRRLTALVRGMSERVIELSTLGVQNRIHAELLRLAADAGVRDNTARLSPAPTHADIASRVSTNREQVTRELSVLTRAGLLKKERTALIVLDVARLQRTVADVRATT